MKKIVKAWICGLSALCAVVCLPNVSAAQSLPIKPVRFVVPYPPGGLVDVLTRAITAELGKSWAAPVLVESKPGASGNIAVEYVFRAPPDSYSILHTDSSAWFTNEFLRKTKPPYDLDKDFVPVIGTVMQYSVLNVRNGLPVSNVKELVAYLKANPNAKYSSYGVGSLSHIGMEAFLRQAGVTASHIPYQGGAPAIRAMMGDEVDFGFNGTNAIPFVQEGKIKGVGVASDKRWSSLPNVPTVAESAGFPFILRAWFVFLAPATTPESIVAKLREDVGKITGSDEFRKKYLEPNSWENFPLYGKELRDFLAADRKEFEARVKPLGLQLE